METYDKIVKRNLIIRKFYHLDVNFYRLFSVSYNRNTNNVLTVLNVQMNEKKKFFKNKSFCDIHLQEAQDIRPSAKYTKFFYFLPKKLPLYENHQKSAISYRWRK